MLSRLCRGTVTGGYHLFVVAILLLDRCHRDAVQVTLATLCDPAATLLLIPLDDTDTLEGLKDLAVDSSRCVDVVRRPRPPVLGAPMDLPQATDANGLADVDVACDRSSTDVEPK